MNLRFRSIPLHVILLLGVAGLANPAAIASDDSLITALFSKVSNGYVRQKLPDGSFKPEYFALSNGGYTPGSGRDPSIDDVPFSTIAVVAGKYLAREKYFLAENSQKADLLLVISWGKTIPFGDGAFRQGQMAVLSAMNQVKAPTGMGAGEAASRNATGSAGGGRGADGIQSATDAVAGAARDAFEGQLFELQVFNSMRSKANESNARLLGYTREINSRNDPSRYAGAGTAYDDLIEDIESERYYIIVTAYDFRAATQEKKKKQLWSTRISIQSQGTRFDEAMVSMLATASRKFGQNSDRLIRQYQTGYKVEYGELKVLGIVPQSKEPEKPAGEK